MPFLVSLLLLNLSSSIQTFALLLHNVVNSPRCPSPPCCGDFISPRPTLHITWATYEGLTCMYLFVGWGYKRWQGRLFGGWMCSLLDALGCAVRCPGPVPTHPGRRFKGPQLSKNLRNWEEWVVLPTFVEILDVFFYWLFSSLLT